MQLMQQYIRLCAGCQGIGFGQPFEITIAQVASILYCTLRNATLTLKKMQSQGWIIWQPGRGRGNLSTLICVLEPADLVLSIAKELVQKGEIRASRELIGQYQKEWPVLEKDFARWMSSQFGPNVKREKGKAGRVDTLRLFNSRPLLALDPIHLLLRDQAHLAKHVCECLVRFDPQKKRVEPHLAFYWEKDESGCEWTFYLRKGVLFHHGRVLTAEDVCYSLDRLQEHGTWHRWIVRSIESVAAIDDYVVRIVLNQPDELFLHALSKEYTAIVPRDYVEQMGEQFARLPVGTGPFRVVRNDDSMLVLEVFEPYFAGRPFLDRIEVWCVPGIQIEMENDYGHHLLRVTQTDDKSDSDHTSWRGFSRQERCFQYVSINGAKKGPLRSHAFRAALAALIAVEDLRRDLGGPREPAEAWGDTHLLAKEAKEAKEVEAKQLPLSAVFHESGYTGEVLRLYTYPDPDHAEDAEWIRDRCARYGISIEIVYARPEQLAETSILQDADFVIDSANVDERRELSLLEFLHGEALSIRHHQAPDVREEVESQVQSLRSVSSVKERDIHVEKIARTLREQHVFVPLYSNRIDMLAHPSLSGVNLDAYGWSSFTSIFFRL